MLEIDATALAFTVPETLAVLEQVLGDLVEGLVGRLGLELLRAVPAGVFVERHRSARPWG